MVESRERSASDGCLGDDRRRRTRQSAKSLGELAMSCDPGVSEWGNPANFRLVTCFKTGANLGK